MRTYLLPENGNFYKTNLHCHTTISDGTMTPEEIKETYKAMGYSAVCFTDHEVLIGHEDLCDDSFIALHGYEVAIKKNPDDHTGLFQPVYHMNLISEDQKNLTMPMCNLGLTSWPGACKEWFEKYAKYDKASATDHNEYNTEWINRYIKTVTEAGFLVTYNHPMWSLQTMEDYADLKGLRGVEVINGGCIAFNDNTSIHMEILLRRGTDVLPVAGDDNHGRKECGRCFTMINAPALTYKDLIDGYKKGSCYASEGPEILELSLENGRFRLRTDRPCTATLLSEGRHIRTTDFTECADLEFKPSSAGRYVRFEVRDKEGKKAFTRAYLTADYIG